MAHTINLTPLTGKHRFLWRAGQVLGLIVTGILIVGFFWRSEGTLGILWNVLIPVLPATFLITPALWRGLCPLATLNTLSNGLLGKHRPSIKTLPRIGTLGIVLLALLVPARRFLLNENATVLAVVIIAVAVLALSLGAIFDSKAGFCNTICPVLPVEKLYGQYPLLKVGNPRCDHCRLCTPKGCIDLVPRKSLIHMLGPVQQTHAWLKTTHGLFAAAFPGFVIGYFTTSNVPLVEAGTIYLNMAAWTAGSYLATVLLVFLFKLKARRVLPILAAAAVGLYYWFAGPAIADAIGLAEVGTMVIRSAALMLVGLWLWRALVQVRIRPEELSTRPVPQVRLPRILK